MEKADIDLPLDYWNKMKEFLKQARLWFCFGKVRMIEKKCISGTVIDTEKNEPYEIKIGKKND